MPPRNVAGRRALTVVGVCTAVLTLPVGLAEAATPSASHGSIISINDCGDGLTVTIGGGSIVTIGLPGDDCPTPSPSASPSASASPFPICTLPPPPTTPPPTTPAPSISHAATPPPTVAPSTSPPPSPQAAAQPIPTPPAPSPSPPKPTPVRPTPRAAASTVLIVPSAQTFHTVPFKRLSTVLIVFIIAIVPVSIARIRYRRRS